MHSLSANGQFHRARRSISDPVKTEAAFKVLVPLEVALHATQQQSKQIDL
jgi:hypothetical protein